MVECNKEFFQSAQKNLKHEQRFAHIFLGKLVFVLHKYVFFLSPCHKTHKIHKIIFCKVENKEYNKKSIFLRNILEPQKNYISMRCVFLVITVSGTFPILFSLVFGLKLRGTSEQIEKIAGSLSKLKKKSQQPNQKYKTSWSHYTESCSNWK